MSDGEEAGSPSRPWATWSLASACCLIFAWNWAQSGFVLFEDAGRLDLDVLRDAGALDWLALREQEQWWRLGSAALLHGAWWHLFLNLWALVLLGAMVEGRYGRGMWFLSVITSGLLSGLVAMAWGGADVVVGVSGVVFGLGGFWLVAPAVAQRAQSAQNPSTDVQAPTARLRPLDKSKPSRRGPHEIGRRELLFWLGLALVVGLFWSELSQAGHIGGLAGGVLIGLGLRWVRLAVPMALIGMSIGFLSGRAALAEPQSAGQWARLGHALMEAKHYPAAWAAFDDALGFPDVDPAARAQWLNAGAYARALGSSEAADWSFGLKMVRESLLEQPENPDRLDTLGWLLCVSGDRVAGKLVLVRAKAASGGEPSVEVLEHLASCG